MKIFLLFLTFSSLVFAQNYTSDSLIVQALLDSNGWNSFTVEEISEVSGNRITGLNLRGESIYTSEEASAGVYSSWFFYRSITWLPAEIGNLTALEKLDLGGHQLSSLPSTMGNLVNLKYLYLDPEHFWNNTIQAHINDNNGDVYYGDSLRHKYYFWNDTLLRTYAASGRMNDFDKHRLGFKLSALPATFTNLANLVELDISNNILDSIPSYIGNRTGMTKLWAAGIDLSQFPSQALNLVNLELLDLGRNIITTVPSGISALTKLKSLNLSGNEIASLPETMGNLTALSDLLDVSINELTSLPQAIGNFTLLKRLNIDHNMIAALPTSIGNCASLTRLDAEVNCIASLPSTIGGLDMLDTLYLEWNNLACLPPEIGGLAKIKNLQVMHNNLTSLPDEFCNLATLAELRIDHNQLASLPDAFGMLFNLVVLEATNNKLTTMPASCASMSLLNRVYLSNNLITSLPARVGSRPSDLQLNNNLLPPLPATLTASKLSMRNNKLTSLSGAILKSSLGFLDVSFNELTALPDSISRATNLGEFHAAGNRITAIPAPFLNLTNLSTVDFHHNELTELPDSIGYKMTRLTFLDVRGNSLSTLPASLGKLTNSYMEVYADSNRISWLPDSLIAWRHDIWLFLNFNHLTVAGLPSNIRSQTSVFQINYNWLCDADPTLDYWLRGRTSNYQQTQDCSGTNITAAPGANVLVNTLSQNTPNPFNPSTSITFSITSPRHVSLQIYDVKGGLVTSLVNAPRQAGRHSVTWDARGLGSGIYYYRLVAGDFKAIKKCIVIK